MPHIEPLEARIAPATLLALTDTDQLLRFDSATPGTIQATVSISGLGAGEDVVGIDFRPATGQLFGLGVDGTTARILTINPLTGATAQVGGTFTVSGTSFGFDFNPTIDRIRVVSDTDINLAVNPEDGVVTTQTALNPGNPNVVNVAYTNSFPGATSTVLFGLDTNADTLVTITPAAAGTVANVGAGLGVDAGAVGGFDVGHGKNQAFAALNVGGVKTLHSIDLTAGTAATLGAIGGAGTAIRGLSVVQHMWDGDGVDAKWSTAANWVAGIVPRAGDAVLFPNGPANKAVTYDLPNPAPLLNSLRFTGADYTISGASTFLSLTLDGGITMHAAGTNTIASNLRWQSGAGTSPGLDVVEVIDPLGTLAFTGTYIANAAADQGLEFTGAGTVRLAGTGSNLTGPTPIVFDAGNVIVDGSLGTSVEVVIQSGAVTVNGFTTKRVQLQGGTLGGSGSVSGLLGTGGTLASGTESLTITGNFTTDAATTLRFEFPSDGYLEPLTVASSSLGGPTPLIALGDAQLAVVAPNGAPARFPLLINTGTEPIGGTFGGLPEGATVMVGAQAYAITYSGGDGNDILLARTGGPAPTIAANGKSATFTDVDGEPVTVTTTKGAFAAEHFFLRDTGGGRLQLELLDLQRDPLFTGANISFKAKKTADGDGLVDIGGIDAAGIDLGTVKIPGDLAFIDAGDGVPTTPALKGLDVASLGMRGLSTGATDLRSDIDGSVGSVKIRGDLRDAYFYVQDSTVDDGGSSGTGMATIKSLSIGGSLIGGDRASSGRVEARDLIVAATIRGDIVGGAGLATGLLFGLDGLGKVTVGGSVLGGAGGSSGEISGGDDLTTTIKIGGDVAGGAGGNSGVLDVADLKSLTIGGSVFGSAFSAGRVDADSAVKVVIKGDIRGGAILGSGNVEFSGSVGSVTIGGSILGGGGTGTGVLEARSMKSLTIKGSVLGEGASSGTITIDDELGKAFIGGDLRGGDGNSSGQLEAEVIGSLTIKGDFVGGAGTSSGLIGGSGNRIGQLTIGGSVIGGTGNDSAQITTLANTDGLGKLKVGGDFLGGAGDRSGIIRTFGGLTSLEVRGEFVSGTGIGSGRIAVQDDAGTIKLGAIRGTAAHPVLITIGATTSPVKGADLVLKSLTVKGDVEHAQILAGWEFLNGNAPIAKNADAQVGTVSVGGDWTASSIVAGVQDDTDTTLDAFFGDADDRMIAGGDAEIVSRIASITIKGVAAGTEIAGDHFGFVAQHIAALKVGKMKFALAKDPGNDLTALPVGSTSDFLVRELAVV